MYKRFFVFILVLLLSSFVCASAEDLTVYHTEHFLFSAPYGLEYSPASDDTHIYLLDSTTNPISAITLDDITRDTAVSSDYYYSLVLESFKSSDLVSYQNFNIGADPALIVTANVAKSPDSPPDYACSLYLSKGKYLAVLYYHNPALSAEEIEARTLKIAGTLVFNPLECAARKAFGDHYISSKKVSSSGCIFIEVDLHGKRSSSMISNLEEEATDFLESIRSLPVDFTEISFQGYTDLIDVYGNFSRENVIQFWITRETLDKINFERFIPTNIEAIATNWYLHPSMKK